MRHRTDDLRIQSLRPLLPPAILMEEIPVDEAGTERWRAEEKLATLAAWLLLASPVHHKSVA
jgi:hypothetical protein